MTLNTTSGDTLCPSMPIGTALPQISKAINEAVGITFPMPDGWTLRKNKRPGRREDSWFVIENREGDRLIGFRFSQTKDSRRTLQWFRHAEWIETALANLRSRSIEQLTQHLRTMPFNLGDPIHVSMKLLHGLLTTSQPLHYGGKHGGQHREARRGRAP